MKKLLLGFAALSLAATSQAQHLSLYEEFSGENCGPCAASNPGLNTLLGANTNKVMLIKYQSPIPSAGPIYTAYTTQTAARLTYYNVPFAPYGRLNGTGLGTGTAAPSSPGHIANLTQADIDAGYAAANPFTLTAAHVYNVAGDSITATINIAALTAFAPTGANLKLRVAIVEHLSYCSAPGTNGETEFHNVVRDMYPDAGGTQLANSWTVGQTQTVTVKGKLRAAIDKAQPEVLIVAWIQNDADKSIPEATKSVFVPITRDGSIKGCPTSAALTCAAGGTSSVANSVTLKNTGTTALTSATIFYKVDNGTYTSYSWTGNLAANATATVTIPPASVTAGVHTVTDSIGTINGLADINVANNTFTQTANVYNSTAATPLPFSTDFENAGALPTNYILYDVNSNNENWILVTGAGLAHNGSSYMLRHYNYAYASGETNYAILPSANLPAGAKALNFYEAYAQYQAENDKLEVVYSTNCGSTWTSIWNQAGSTLATAPATTSSFVPSASQWKGVSVDISAVPATAMLALRATSAYGNNLYVDDIQMRAGPTAVTAVKGNLMNVSIAPNPAQNAAVLTFSLAQSSDVQVQVLDAVGRVVATPANGAMQAGAQSINLNTTNMPAGLYNVVIRTGEGVRTERLSVVK